jgi:Subtilase family
MGNDHPTSTPRHYFLNERHQLSPADKEGGGSTPKTIGIEWKTHGTSLSKSLEAIKHARRQSVDPTSNSRLFVVAKPAALISKESKAKTAIAGEKQSSPDFAGKQSQVLAKMGFDLIAVQQDGSAIVHATATRLKQIEQTLTHLAELSQREKNKWATLTDFEELSPDYKTSADWWPLGGSDMVLDCVIDFQPLIPPREVDLLIVAIKKLLTEGEKLQRIGVEFTGRKWLGAKLKSATIRRLCQDFQAIYSIHPPLIALAAASGPIRKPAKPLFLSHIVPADPHALPCVGVIDTGIPEDHVLLAPYRIGQKSGQHTSGEVQCSHGSLVAGRVVFGDIDCVDGDPVSALEGKCSVYDLRLGQGAQRIYEASVTQAIADVVESAPHVRVFNLSFDSLLPLEGLVGSRRDAALRLLADLDNRAFELDIICVVAAGNSVEGVVPTTPYPAHFEEPEWQLRTWSRCFNALTCGGIADEFNAEGVANEVGAPSPFSRVGPGFAKSRKPDFSAPAGNCDSTYQRRPGSGLGVWCCNESGQWEDHFGTSYAAPLLAREAARIIAYLQKKCEPGTRPFASLVKAVMGLCAKRPDLPKQYAKLAKHTLGFGRVTLEDVEAATEDRALFLWQGIIGSEEEVLTVELPLPGEWVKACRAPILRLVCAWETPVNSAAEHIWACRRMDITLRPLGGAEALKPSNTNSKGYPLIERIYALGGNARTEFEANDACLLELKYTHLEMAEYPAGILDFTPQQRISLAFEIHDAEEGGPSPHPYVQSLPVAGTLNRLSTILPAARQAVSIRAFD